MKIASGAIAGLLLALAVAFGLLQTTPGKAWLAQRLAAALSGSGERATVAGIQGLVPFDMRIGRIELADAQGPRLTISNAVLAIAPADLLALRLRVRELGARDIRIERPSQSGGSTPNPTTLLHPPLDVVVERLNVDRIELGPALLGAPVALTLAASGRLGGGSAAMDIDLHRVDGAAGNARFHFALSGEPLRLELAGDIAEPSGRLLARLLDRGPLPFTIHLAGNGPLADWHGRLTAAAGNRASLVTDFSIARDGGYRVSAEAQARIAALLPPRLQPLLADDTSLSATVHIADDAVALDALNLAAATGTVAASGKWTRDGDAISAQATLDLPVLAALAPLSGRDIDGAAKAELAVSGTLAAPSAHVIVDGNRLTVDGNHLARASAALDLHAKGDPLAPATLELAGSGRLTGLSLAATVLPAGLGDTIDWRLAGELDRAAMRLDLSELGIASAGNTLAAHGRFTQGDVAGAAHLDVPDVSPFAGAALHGALALDADIRGSADGAATVRISGTLRRDGAAASPVEALLGNEATLAAKLERHADGALAASDVTLKAANGTFSGEGSFAADRRVAAEFRMDLPRLAAIEPRVAGSAIVDGTVSGTADAPATHLALRGKELVLSGTPVKSLEATLDTSGLAQPRGTLAVKFAVAHLNGTASAEGTLLWPGSALSLDKIRVDAAGTRLDGAATYRFAAGTIEGRLNGTAPDLKPWSAIIGTPVAGSAQIEATLGGGNRLAANLTLDGKNLTWGAASPATVQRARLAAQLSDLLGEPQGHAELQIDNAKSGATTVTQARLSGRSERPGRFALEGSLRGTAGAPLDLATTANLVLGRGRIELRVSRLSGKFGNQSIALCRPLVASRRGADLAFAELDLGIGRGRLSGSGAVKANALSLHLLADRLPVGLFAALGGQPDVTGLLGFETTLSGTRARPQGDVVIDAEQLRFAAASHPDLPPLGFVASASWRGDRVEMKGRLAGPENAAIGFAGAVPLKLDPKSLKPSLPRAGALTFHVEGEGELANLADLLPLAENRLAGKFTIDVSVGGTVGSPDASGRLSLRDGRYESLSYGTILAGMSFDLVGNRDRLVLQHFTATDSERGTVTLAGAVNLAAAAGPTFDFGGNIKSFRAVRRDDVNAVVSGDVRLTGTVTAPSLAARLRIETAELRVPERLPQNVQPIDVVRINSATGQVLSTPEEQSSKHLLVIALGITVDMPGQVFVRGRGLDSEWRGRLALNGTSAEPQLTGKLEVVRGTFAFLGRTATLSKGTITFLGGAKIDPAIDIEARVASTDVTAIVRITGTATQPQIALSSQPELPQDEILSRVLFGTSVSQIGPGQGLEIAQAAASLAMGGGPGVLDRIRSGLGLDRLTFGASGNSNSPFNNAGVPSLAAQPGIPGSMSAGGVGTSPLPAGAGTSSPSANAAAVSAGKYVASGVYVGVTQGITSGSSSVDVQIDVSRHITLDTTAGQATGAGIGVNWKLDY